MWPSIPLILSLLLSLIHAQQMFEIDCTNCPQACNNRCYAVYHAGAVNTLTWDQPTAAVERQRRTASGCKQSNGLSVCGTGGKAPYNSDPNSGDCDEYPQASTQQSGAGAILRCMPASDNRSEGGQLAVFYNKPVANGGCGGVAPCQFTIFLKADSYTNADFCFDDTKLNDGTEFTLNNGAYVDAKRRRDESEVVPHVPDPRDYVPVPQRRQFLLSTGKTTLLVSNDMNTTFDGKLMATVDGPVTIVKELFGDEKDERFRPSK
ncbi:hypothetical protein D6C98_10693 [Aureobasidium pullulans]|nr:hypothetical protein D6C98_10693 [Aureobasidium pullulans]